MFAPVSFQLTPQSLDSPSVLCTPVLISGSLALQIAHVLLQFAANFDCLPILLEAINLNTIGGSAMILNTLPVCFLATTLALPL